MGSRHGRAHTNTHTYTHKTYTHTLFTDTNTQTHPIHTHKHTFTQTHTNTHTYIHIQSTHTHNKCTRTSLFHAVELSVGSLLYAVTEADSFVDVCAVVSAGTIIDPVTVRFIATPQTATGKFILTLTHRPTDLFIDNSAQQTSLSSHFIHYFLISLFFGQCDMRDLS